MPYHALEIGGILAPGADKWQPPVWGDRRLWNLWDMVNFSFTSVHTLLRELAILIQTSHHNMRTISLAECQREQEIFEDAAKSANLILGLYEKHLLELKCGHIDSAARRLQYWANHKPREWSELNVRARALRDAIETELREYLFYRYPKDKGLRLVAWDTEWKAAIGAFPDIKLDVFSAIDCYALQHNIASVFHSMRIAEHGLRALAHERRITLPKNKQLEWATWQEIIKALDDEIKVIGGKKAGAVKDSALAFYSGARADLNGFKDEYRNLVMHVRATYDEFQAVRVLTNVHAFMTRLAAKIDHTRQQINWGDL